MADLAAASLMSVAVLFLIVVMSATLTAEHTDANMPKGFLLGGCPPRRGRNLWLVEIPFIVVPLAIGQLAIVLALVHPASTLPVRVITGAELAVVTAWFVYLARLFSRAT